MHISPFYLVATLSLGLSALGKKTKNFVCSNRASEQCLIAKHIPYKVPCDSDYKEYSLTHNLRLPIKPAAIVLPKDSNQVSAAVICAGRSGVKVQAKSGGPRTDSYGSYSSGGIDGQVMIDLRNFNKTVLSTDGTNIAKVGGGVRLGPMASAVYEQGNRAISHGICPSVGIGGHSTHGGWGYTSRAWGLTLDHIVSMDVVLANGTVTRASPTQHPDLYWAMRGAADSIGIATSISLKTHPAPEEVCVFIYEFPTVAESVQKSVSMLMGIQSYMSNATLVDRRLSLSMQTTGNPDPESGSFTRGLLIAGVFMGNLSEFTSRIEPELLRQAPDAPLTHEVQSYNWINSLRRQSPDGTLDGKPESLDFFGNSVTINSPGLTEEAVTNYFTYLLTGPAPPVSFEASMELWGGADSQINLAAKNTSFAAFPHRSVFWTAHNRAGASPDAPFPEEGITFLNGLRQAIIDGLHAPTAAYPNLLDTSLTREEAHKLYYGDEVLARLQRIKAAYDPRNLFWNPQSI
ncbi:hypothetical protein F5144DRAFT_534331 [Chaetomium tenue]|uniref:Uncharacterized protein n=1 Tax=Chaetomium tenue TaxID=1854479 RepID=A0ACB7P8I2_9PEZI|nr:hypothetical protein F5144DRAFT_534331 [Chaetomium globosum]